MKSLIRSILQIATLGLYSPNKSQPISTAKTSRRGESLDIEALRALFHNSVGLVTRGGYGMIAIRRAARTTNQRKRRKNFRRIMAAGGA